MKKKANRRAFFVCAVMCLMYAAVIANLPEKMTFERLSHGAAVAPKGLSLSAGSYVEEDKENKDTVTRRHDAPTRQKEAASPPGEAAKPETPSVSPPSKEPAKTTEITPGNPYDSAAQEPSILLSVPLIAYALKEGLLEREGLVFTKKDGSGKPIWKKPLDILKDRDVEGLRNISGTIGKAATREFLKKEGIPFPRSLEAEDAMFGKGFSVEKEKLAALYRRYVTEEYSGLFPFVFRGTGVFRNKDGYEITKVREQTVSLKGRDDSGWMMPNLGNMSLRVALEKLMVHTSKVKIHGNGYVTDQFPKPFERMHGETECVLYGRTGQ